jgi:hypothetical protein
MSAIEGDQKLMNKNFNIAQNFMGFSPCFLVFIICFLPLAIVGEI